LNDKYQQNIRNKIQNRKLLKLISPHSRQWQLDILLMDRVAHVRHTNEGRVAFVHTRRQTGWVEVSFHQFLCLALDACDWAVPNELEGGQAPKPIWTFLRKEEISCPCQEWNP
jgi:hypothetical protein